MRKKMRKGFTMVEIMVVIAIIGLLAVILIPKISSVKDAAKNAGVQSNMRAISTALEGLLDSYNTPTELEAALVKTLNGSLTNPFNNGTAALTWADKDNVNCAVKVYQNGLPKEDLTETQNYKLFSTAPDNVNRSNCAGQVLVAITVFSDNTLGALIFGYDKKGNPLTTPEKAIKFDGSSASASYAEAGLPTSSPTGGEITSSMVGGEITNPMSTPISTPAPIVPKLIRLGGLGDDVGNSISKDSSGNIVVVGRVIGAADLNGDGVISLSGPENSIYGGSDIFISKFTNKGDFIWSKRLGGAAEDIALSVSISVSNDSEKDNIVVAGLINGNVDLDGDGNNNGVGPGKTAEIGGGIYGGSRDGFISKFNSSGDFLWAKRFGSISDEDYVIATIDSENNIIMASQMEVRYNNDINGNGVAEPTGNSWYTDIFVCKFKPNGDPITENGWPKRIGGSSWETLKTDGMIKTDSTNEIFLTFTSYQTAPYKIDQVDVGEIFPGRAAAILVKLTSTGTCSWAKKISATAGICDNSSVTVDSQDNVILTGINYFAKVDLNGDGLIAGATEEFMGYGGEDIFISKFLGSTGEFQWTKRLGGPSLDLPLSVITDSSNQIYLAGSVTASADLDGDGDTDGVMSDGENGTGYGSSDCFVTTFDTNGNYQWSKRYGGLGSDRIMGLQILPGNKLVMSGYVSSAVDFTNNGSATDMDGETPNANLGGSDAILFYP